MNWPVTRWGSTVAHFMVQYSEEWWQTRRGVPTASQFDKIVTPKAWGASAAMAGYAASLAAETADLRPNWFTERAMSPAQRHGLETEPEARRFYTMARELDPDRVQMVGFCHTTDGRFGCSPDGLVYGADRTRPAGGLELKCVQLTTQAKYLLKGELPREYKPQVHGQLLVCGFEWVDFLSYAPGLDPFLLRVYPDKDTLKLKEYMESFDVLYNATLAKLGVPRHYPHADEGSRDRDPDGGEVPEEFRPYRGDDTQPLGVENPWEEPVGPIVGEGVAGE